MTKEQLDKEDQAILDAFIARHRRQAIQECLDIIEAHLDTAYDDEMEAGTSHFATARDRIEALLKNDPSSGG